MKFLFLILALTFVSITQASTPSLLFYTPEKMQSVFDINYNYGPRLFKRYGDDDFSYYTNILNLTYQFGITDTLSLGASIGGGETVNKTVNKITGEKVKQLETGATDFKINGKWKEDWWIAGIELGISPEVRKESVYDRGTNTSHEGNLYSGGNRIKPSFGVILNSSDFNYGFETSYDYHFESTSKDYTGYTTKTNNDHIFIFSPFIEWNYGSGFLSAKISRNEQYKANYTGFDSDGRTSTYDGDGYIVKTLALSASYNLTPNFTWYFTHEQNDYPTRAVANSMVLFTDSIGARIAF